MDLLEYYQNQHPINDNYVPRKCQLPQKGDINLFGVRGSGKTSIVLDLLEDVDEETALYIDMEDPNLIFSPLATVTLQHFIDRNGISLLVLDHYEEDSLPSFPNVERLIVLSRIKLIDDLLTPIELFPLDYEEFLAFETSVVQNKGFNHFLRSGTLPMLARSQKTALQSMKTFLQSSFDSNEQKLLLILAQHHTKHLTVNQIYTYAKEKFKVSKDWLYKTMKLFTDIMQFDTMIALTLMKHNITVQTLGIHGYVTKENELIIPAPFESEESLWVKSQSKFSIYKKYNIKKVTIVTVANSYEYDIEKLHFEALPFDEWSILHDEDDA
jgi:hypothetical protein